MLETNRPTVTSMEAHTATVAAEPVGLRDAVATPDRRTKTRRDSRGYMLRRLLVATDVAALCIAFAFVESLGGYYQGQESALARDAVLLLLGIPLWVAMAYSHQLYHVGSRRADHGLAEELGPILQMATLWSWAILLCVSVTGVRPVDMAKLAIFWGLTVALLVALRGGARAWSRRRIWYLQNALIVGPPDESAPMVRKIMRHPEYGIHVVGCVESAGGDHEGTTLSDVDLAGFLGPVPMLRGEVDVPYLVDQLDVDRVILTAGSREARAGGAGIPALAGMDGVHIDLVPSWCDVIGRRLDLHEMEGMPLLTLPHTKLGRTDMLRKRAFDFVISVSALLTLLPLLAFCAIVIKLDSRGPVFFRQRRIGRDGQPFEIIKFRSMEQGADAVKHSVAGLNFHGGGNLDGMFKIREDPRVTRVGHWLRRLSLDELPQLINVLRGEMSLVGPRPLIENEDRQVEGRFRERLTLTPGLTGLWQAHGRSDIPFDEMVTLDYLYVTNWSLWADVKLLIRTVGAVVRGSGAY